MPLVLHANCHVPAMKWMTVDLRDWAHRRPRRTVKNDWSIHGLAVCYAYCTKYRSQKSFGHNAEASSLLRSSDTSNNSPDPDQGVNACLTDHRMPNHQGGLVDNW